MSDFDRYPEAYAAAMLGKRVLVVSPAETVEWILENGLVVVKPHAHVLGGAPNGFRADWVHADEPPLA